MQNVKNQIYVRSDNFFERLISSKMFWILSMGLLFAYPVYRSLNRTLPPELPKISKVPQFQMTDEMGKSFGSNDLKGRVYLASFAFTSCPVTCKELLAKMQKVQKRVKGVGNKIALVTFTVDPEHDTPKILYKTARDLRANPYIWKFVTSDKSKMKNLLVKGFKVPMGDKKSDDMMDIAHSDRVVLVDELGHIRGYYRSDKDSINKLMIDVGLLINRSNFNKSQGETNV